MVESKESWTFSLADRKCLDLNIVDMSKQFEILKNLSYKTADNKQLIECSIKYDSTCNRPKFQILQSQQREIEWSFFETYDDFYTKFCDVKIEKIFVSRPLTIDFFIKNESFLGPDLFAACVFQMYPIYRFLRIKNPNEINVNSKYKSFFEKENVNTTIYSEKIEVEFPISNLIRIE